jgi:hypothetical protein
VTRGSGSSTIRGALSDSGMSMCVMDVLAEADWPWTAREYGRDGRSSEAMLQVGGRLVGLIGTLVAGCGCGVVDLRTSDK